MTPELSQEQVLAMKEAIDNNQQDSPSLNIDAKSGKMFVVGDPNNTHPTKGEYKITYAYTEDMVNEQDKKNLKYDETSGMYLATVTYEGKRVKPLYRTKVTVLLANLLTEVGILTEKGYSSKMVDENMGMLFVSQTEQILEIASLVLGETKEHLEYAVELWSFIMQLLQNEPNMLQETMNFLVSFKNQNEGKNPQAESPTTQG